MRLVTYQLHGAGRLGGVVGDLLIDLNRASLLPGYDQVELPSSTLGLLELGPLGVQAAQKAMERATKMYQAGDDAASHCVLELEGTRLLAPVLVPRKLFCLAGNYAEHVREGGGDVPGKERMSPRVFMKPPTTTVRGPQEPIVIPRNGHQIDWEVELAVVVGKWGKHIPPKQAYEHVAGYTVLNDVSERSLRVNPQRDTQEWDHFFDWLNGKWMDSFAPMGPCLALKDEIDDPQNLQITLKVNGTVRQDSNTRSMIFSIPELVAFISSLVTLEPGDVISTGTPSGVGATTGEFLKPGDVVEACVEGIGTLENPVIAEDGPDRGRVSVE